jgi:outer membrane receptor protein involved in Fe transport
MRFDKGFRLWACRLWAVLMVNLHPNILAQETEENEDAVFQLEAFTVVGSRLETVDQNTPSPVLFLGKGELENIGYETLGDVMRNLPFNSGSTIGMEGAATGFSAGVASVNLRGLGNNNTLVLINGRRSSPAGASAFNGFQTVFDFNSVPLALVESTQILKDAGSGIYGSDAVAGVVAIDLIKRFEGTELTLRFGDSTEVNSPMAAFSLIHGWDSPIGAFVLSLDSRWQQRSKYRDRPFSESGDQRNAGGFDLRSPTTYPARVSIGGTFFTVTAPTTMPVFRDNVVEVSSEYPAVYDFNQVEDMFPKVENRGLFLRWENERKSAVTPFAEFSYRQHLTRYTAAPVAMRNTFEQGDGPSGQINWPATNPYNHVGNATFGFDLNDDFRWRLTELGNRIFDNQSDYLRSLFGVKGRIGEHRWETALLYARSEAENTTRNVARDADLQAALNGTLEGFEGQFANPFGPSVAGIFDAMRRSNTNVASFSTASFDGFVSGKLRDGRFGQSRYALGFELRKETLNDDKSPLSEAGQILGGAEGASFKASREVSAFFAEASLPLPFNLEARGAVRSEFYSDFGETTKPKVSISWQPFEGFLLRASYGQAFLAPNLPFLFTPQLTTFSSSPLPDPKRNNERSQIQIRTGGNPALQPEETEVWSAGAVWRQNSSGLGWSAEFSVFRFKQTDLLSSFDASFLIANEDLFPGRVIRSDPPTGAPPGSIGPIEYVDNLYRNVNTGEYRGYDLDFAYALSSEGIGYFRYSVSLTYLDRLSFSARQFPDEPILGEVDFAGAYGNPKWRGNMALSWSRSNWNASVFVNYLHHYQQQFVEDRVSEDKRINLSIGHDDVFGWAVSIGVRNLLNEIPPFDFSRAEGYNLSVNSGESRFYTVSFRRRI